MAQLNMFEDFPLHRASTGALLSNQIGRLLVWHNYIPGSVSFNKLAMLFNGVQTNGSSGSISFSFGLYSFNASTLSLANSASFSSNFSSNDSLNHYTFATSAAQNLAGDWWFAIMSSTNGGSRGVGYGAVVNEANQTNNSAAVSMGGPFMRGQWSATTNALPASMATSNLSKEISASTVQALFPYILITA